MCTPFYEDLLNFLNEKSNPVYKTSLELLQETAKDYKKVGADLFYKRNEQEILVLTTKAEQIQAIENVHCANKDSHIGRWETYYKLGEKFHWRGIRMDVEMHISGCDSCSKLTSNSSNNSTLMQCYASPIWKQVNVEVVGPLPKGSCGEMYAVVVYDTFSQWIETKAANDNSAAVIGEFLVECFARHSMAKCIFSNHISKSCVSKIQDYVTKRWESFMDTGCDSSSILKSWNVLKTDDFGRVLEPRDPLFKRIKDWLSSCDGSWTTQLLPKVHALRRSVTEEDGISPFQILYGKLQVDFVLKHGNANGATVPKKIFHTCEVCSMVFCSQRALRLHSRKHDQEVEDGDKDVIEKLTEIPNGDNGSRTYGLRTNLRASGKSAIVTRMMHRSRTKRSADMASDGVLQDISDSGANPTKLLRVIEITADSTMSNVDAMEDDPCKTVAGVDASELEKPKKKKRGRPRKKIIEAINEDTGKNADAENASKVAKKSKDAIHMIFVCRVCVPTFAAHAKNMELHNACHRENSKLFFCSQCSYVAGLWTRMRDHLRKQHPEMFRVEEEDELDADCCVEVDGVCPAEDITCAMCPMTVFRSRTEAELHMECHKDGSRLLHCQFCNLVESRWEALKLHLAIAHEKIVPLEDSGLDEKDEEQAASKVFSCETCNIDIKGYVGLQRHMQMHKKAVYECDDCDFATRVWTSYVDHRTSHLYVGYNCQVCKKHFAKRERLKVHMEVHQENRASAVCDKCGLTLLGAVALKRHLKNMHGDGSEKYPCPLCPYVGKTRIYLRKHVSHLHNKPLNCDLCDFGCHSQVVLDKHKDMFHNEEGRKYPCTECGYRGRDAKQLSEHVRFHHNPKSPRFKCDVCGTTFRSHTMLRDHLPLHSNQCDYECQICGYKTRYRRTMYRHAQNKHKGSPASAVFKGTSTPPKAAAKTPKRKPRVKKGAGLQKASEPQPEKVVLLPEGSVVEVTENEEYRIGTDLGERNVVLTTCDGQLLSLEGLSGEHSIVLDAALLDNGHGTITLQENVHFQIIRTCTEDDQQEFDGDPAAAGTGIILAIGPDSNETSTITLVAASDQESDLVIDGDFAEGDKQSDTAT